ncbi:17926_t:CDS:2, partial [Dentiscutata erythropus]
PLKVKKSGEHKMIVEVRWDGTGIKDHEKVITKLHGCNPSGTLTYRKDKKKHKFSDRETTYELAVHKKNVPVECKLEFTGDLPNKCDV